MLLSSINSRFHLFIFVISIAFASISCKGYLFAHEIDRPFVVIMIGNSYDPDYRELLSDTLAQNYSAFRIECIDTRKQLDCHPEFKELIHKADKPIRVQPNVRHNQMNSAILNVVLRARYNEIIYFLPESSTLSSRYMLSNLNLLYSDSDCWGIQQPSKLMKSKKNQPFTLRSFYAILLQQLPLKYLLNVQRTFDNDLFFDNALFAANRQHIFFANFVDVIQKIPQRRKARRMGPSSLSKYILQSPHDPPPQRATPVTDIVIFSYDRPLQLHSLLKTIHSHTSGFSKIFVIYRASSDRFLRSYARTSEAHPKVEFIQQSHTHAKQEFKQLVLDTTFDDTKSTATYVTFAVDDIIVKDKIDFRDAITQLERYQAHGFFFRLGKSVTESYMAKSHQGLPCKSFEFEKNLILWQFSSGKHDWCYPNCLDFTTYKKSVIKADFEELDYHTPNELEGLWNQRAKLNDLGICYFNSKILNIPINIVGEFASNRNNNSYTTSELLLLYEQGYLLDTQQLYKMPNQSAHIDYKPNFIHKGKRI